MSKTVMRVIMIGLVAMLGAEAAAHILYVPPSKPRVCSPYCDDPKLIEVPEDPNNLGHIDPSFQAAAAATTKKVLVLCPNGTEVIYTQPITVSIIQPSAAWIGWDSVKQEARVNVELPVRVFQELGLCGQGVDPDAVKVQFLSLSEVKYSVHQCTDPSDLCCSSKALVSSMTLKNCTVPRDALTGTLWSCASSISTDHSF